MALGGIFGGATLDPSGHLRVAREAFQASAAISGKEFGLTWELERESGRFLLGRDIIIEIQAEVIRLERARCACHGL